MTANTIAKSENIEVWGDVKKINVTIYKLGITLTLNRADLHELMSVLARADSLVEEL